MSAVSRETPQAPPPPPAARDHFGDRIAGLATYADLLATAGVERGLLGPREVPRLWERHLLNCAVAVDLVPETAQVADVGSGAGLPGLTWALVRTDLDVTLIEPMGRRSDFLTEAVAILGLDRVTVLRARAEELHGSREFDVVTARAVAPLDRLVGWCLPLVRPGGALLALKGVGVAAEIEAANPIVHRLGGVPPTVETLGHDVLETPATVARVVASGVQHVGGTR